MDRVPDFGSGGGGSNPSGRIGWGSLIPTGLAARSWRGIRAVFWAFLTAHAAFADSAQLHNTAGLAFFYQAKYTEAFNEFVAALKKDPTFAAPHFNLGRVFEAQQRYEDAKEQYRQCLQLDPTHLGAQQALKRLSAVAVRPKPVDEPPPAPEVLDLVRQKEKLREWIKAGELEGAEKRLYALLKTFGNDAELHDLLARVFEAQDRFDAALEESRRAAAFEPGRAAYRYRYASNLFRLGRFDESIAEATRAAELTPNDWRVYYLLGLAHQRLDKLDQAFVNFEEAARINPEDKAVRQHLNALANKLGLFNYNAGLYHFSQKNWEEAKKHLDLALRKGNLNDEQRAIAQQYLIVADFSAQDVAGQIRKLQSDRRNEQRGFVQKRLTFEEVERSPTIWRQGYHVFFTGRVAYISRDRRELLVETEDENDIRSADELKSWFKVKIPEPLPQDPRIRTILQSATRPDGRGGRSGNRVQVEGQLAQPEYLTNPYNGVLGREPQPVVKATFLTFRSEDNLAGDLRLDFLQFKQAKSKVDNPGPATPLLPTVGAPIPLPLETP